MKLPNKKLFILIILIVSCSTRKIVDMESYRQFDYKLKPYKGYFITYHIIPKDDWPIQYQVISDSIYPLRLNNEHSVISSTFAHDEIFVPFFTDRDVFTTYIDLYGDTIKTLNDIMLDEISNFIKSLDNCYEEEYKIKNDLIVYREYVKFYGILCFSSKYLEIEWTNNPSLSDYNIKRACIPITFNIIPFQQ